MFAPIKEKDDVIETVKEEKRKLELNLADTYSRMQKLMEENERLQSGDSTERRKLEKRVEELEKRPTQHELDEIVKEKEKLDELFTTLRGKNKIDVRRYNTLKKDFEETQRKIAE